MRLALLPLALLLAGCDRLPTGGETASQPPSDGWGKARIVEDNEAQIGRFQFHPANGDIPALVFDSSTGCIEIIEKYSLDGKPKQAVLIRKISDEVIEGTPKRCSAEKPSQVIKYDAQGNRVQDSSGAVSTSSAAGEK